MAKDNIPQLPEEQREGTKLTAIRVGKVRRERLSQVQRLYYVEHIPQPEIALQLGVTIHQIKKDIRLIKDLAQTTVQEDVAMKSNVLTFFWEMNEKYQRRIRELWDTYDKAHWQNETPFALVKILREIRENDKQYTEMLQQAGIRPKEPEKHLHAGVIYVSHLGKEKPKTIVEEKKNEKVNVVNAVAVPV